MRFYRLVSSFKDKSIYIREDMCYIRVGDKVYGISFKMAKYCGYDVKKLIGKLLKLKGCKTVFHKYDLFDGACCEFVEANKYLGACFLNLINKT